MITFGRILDIDSQFIIDYINKIYQLKEDYHRNHKRDFSFIWRRNDYNYLINKAINHIYNLERHTSYFLSLFAAQFFIQEKRIIDDDLLDIKNINIDKDIISRQENFLITLIKSKSKDSKYMNIVFNIIHQFSYKRRLQFIETFTKSNISFEGFEKLPLDPHFYSYHNSRVHYHHNLVNYYNAILTKLNTLDLIRHRKYIERKISEHREMVEKGKKDDFKSILF